MRSLLLASAIAPLLVYCVDAISPNVDHPPHRYLKSKKSAKKTICDPKFSNMFVFGDSLSDQGNLVTIVENPLLKPGFATNGKFAVEYIAEEFGVDLQMSNHLLASLQSNPQLITGTNYAVAQAQAARAEIVDTPLQIDAFMTVHKGKAPSDALYVVFIGGNDIKNYSYDDRYLDGNLDKTDEEVFTNLRFSVKSIVELLVQPLIDAGARDIVVVDSAPIHLIPFVNLNQPPTRATAVERAFIFFNNELKEALRAVECLNNMNIVHHQEIAELFTEADKKGLQVESPCVINFAGIPGGIPPIPPLNGTLDAPYLWDPTCNLPDAPGFATWDEIHPTTAVHQIIAEGIINQIRTEICPDKRMRSSTKACRTSKSKANEVKASKSSKEKASKSSKGKSSKNSKGKAVKSSKGKKFEAKKIRKTKK